MQLALLQIVSLASFSSLVSPRIPIFCCMSCLLACMGLELIFL